MAQHLLLMAIAPPLILLGAPALPLLRGLPGRFIRSVVGPFPAMERCEMAGTRDHQSRDLLAGRRAGVDRMAYPARCLNWRCGGAGCTNSSTPAFSAPDFCSGGPYFNPGRAPRAGLAGPFRYIFSAPRCPATCFPHFLCSAIGSSTRPIFPRLARSIFRRSHDQQCAAALMWTCVTIIFLVPAVVVTMQILSRQRVDAAASSEAFAGVAAQMLADSKAEII